MKIFFLIIFLLIFTSKIFSTPGPQWIWYNTSNSEIPANNLSSIEIDSNNVKWLGCGNGLIKFDNNSWFLYNSANSPVINSVQIIKKDGFNGIWFYVYSKGLFFLKNGVFTIYNSTNSGLPFNNLYSLAIESDSIKWMGSADRLVRFNGLNWSIFDTSNSGYKHDVAQTIEISGHTKWFGSFSHGLGKFNDTSWTYYNNQNSGLQDVTIYSISIVNPSLVWVGTRFSGVQKFNLATNQWTYYNTSNSPLPENEVKAITNNKINGDVFMGPRGFGVAKLSDTTWTLYGPPIPDGNFAVDFRFDKFNNLWIATSDGLFVYNSNGIVGINDQSSIINDFQLFQNYPNPFNPTTKINYELRITNYVTLKVHDLQGKEIATLLNERQNSGLHSVNFNSSGLASGIYFYTLKTGSFSETKRMVLIK